MSYLYVTEHGATIGVEENYVYVKQSGDIVRKIPLETLDAVALFGKSQLSTQAIELFLREGIPVSFYSPIGKYAAKDDSIRVYRIRGRSQVNNFGRKYEYNDEDVIII